MEKKYDVIVVGAGNGGLVAAATTAKAKLDTLLLEKHNLPGGSASSFRRGRFEFEPSLHELCSVGTAEKPSIIYDIFDRLGAKVDWVYEENAFRTIVTGEDGYDVKVRVGLENFCDDVEKAVPGSRKSVRALFDVIEKNEIARAYLDKKNNNPNPLVMAMKYQDFLRSASHSVEEVEIALGIPEKARNIINSYWCYLGIPTDEINGLHYLSMLGSYVNDGAAMPRKRSHEISLALEKVILDNGGKIWYNCEVTEFIYNTAGDAIGVVLADGRKLYAKQIISNVIPHNVYAMNDSRFAPERELKLANSRKFGITFITIYVGLDVTMEELGIKDYTLFRSSEANPRKQFEKIKNDFRTAGYYVANCLNAAIPDCSPEGTSMLFFTVPLYGNQLPDDLTPANYKKFKNEIAESIIKDYEQLMGVDVMNHVEEISIATPVSFARYLGTPDGEVYGYETTDWDNIISRIQSKAKDFAIKNLTFCGGHDVRGDGYSSAYVTGEQAGFIAISNIKKGGK